MSASANYALSACLLAALASGTACGDSTGKPQVAAQPTNPEGDAYAVDRNEVERLRALGYVNVAPALPPDAKVGVVVHDEQRASRGLSLFTNAKFCSTQLIDMHGRVHREWSHEPCYRWGNVSLTANGDL